MKATITKHGAKRLGAYRLVGKTVTCTINERGKADNVFYGSEYLGSGWSVNGLRPALRLWQAQLEQA